MSCWPGDLLCSSSHRIGSQSWFLSSAACISWLLPLRFGGFRDQLFAAAGHDLADFNGHVGGYTAGAWSGGQPRRDFVGALGALDVDDPVTQQKLFGFRKDAVCDGRPIFAGAHRDGFLRATQRVGFDEFARIAQVLIEALQEGVMPVPILLRPRFVTFHTCRDAVHHENVFHVSDSFHREVGTRRQLSTFCITFFEIIFSIPNSLSISLLVRRRSSRGKKMPENAAVMTVSNDWEAAREVQQRFMAFRRGVGTPGPEVIDISAQCRQVQELGGDFYDFMPFPGGRLALAIGDASGKGLAAALMMANVQSSLRTAAWFTGGDGAAAVEAVNRQVHASSLAERYATLFYGVIDPNTRTLRYVNAGHHSPMILHRDGSVTWLETGGAPVGMFSDWSYEEGCVPLASGDLLVV